MKAPSVPSTLSFIGIIRDIIDYMAGPNSHDLASYFLNPLRPTAAVCIRTNNALRLPAAAARRVAIA